LADERGKFLEPIDIREENMNIPKLAPIGILLLGSVSQLSGDRAATFKANAAAGKRRCDKVFQAALAA
jgi:hypothetical protein